MAEAGAFEVRIVAWPSPLFSEVDELRYRVLFEPFGVARDDGWNDADPDSVHAVALAAGSVVGYARLVPNDAQGPQIRQVAVSSEWERRGVGTALMQALMCEARDAGALTVWLNARESAVPFYERLGFRVTSGLFPSGRTGLPHVRMELAL